MRLREGAGLILAAEPQARVPSQADRRGHPEGRA